MPHLAAPHVAVIGAGVTGVTTAYALLERGLQVTLIDRQRGAAMETSFANGGQLSASNAEVWNRTDTILKGLRWMLQRDAPLSVSPRPSWHKYSWMAEFLLAIRRYEANTIETTRLAIAARSHLVRMAEREGIDFDLERRGILHIYETREGFEHAARVNDLLTRGGLKRHAVSPGEVREIEPAIARPLHGGFFTPSDMSGDIHKFTKGLAAACERRGARFLSGMTARRLRARADGVRIETDAETVDADAVVIAAGVGSRALARQAGDRVNVYPVKGYSVTVMLDDARSQAAAPTVSLLDDDTKIVASRLGRGRYRVAGTAEFAGFNRDIRADRIRPLVAWVEKYFPDVDTTHCVPWAGLRPMMPNMMPRLGAGRCPRVFYNTGHGHLGWTLSAATAEMVGDAVAAALPVPQRAVEPLLDAAE